MNRDSVKNKKIAEILLFLTIALSFIILVWRIFHGVEFTDEAFYVELANRISLGNIPLYDMWEQAQTASLFLAPAVFMLRAITGGVEGVVLVARLMYLFYACLSSFLFYMLIQKTVIGKKIAGIMAIGFVFYSPFSIYCVSYNTMINCFLLLMFGVVLNIELTQLRIAWKYFVLGMLLALGALAYPTFVIFAITEVFIYGLLIWIRVGLKDGVKAILWMIVGGLFVASIVTFAFIIVVGYSKMLLGITGILSDSVYHVKSNLYDLIVVKLFETFRYYLVNMKMVFIICIMGIIRLLKSKIPYLYLFMVTVPFYAFYQSYRNFWQAETLITVVSVGALIVVLPFLYFMTEQYKKEIFIISYSSIIISGVGFFIVAASSAGSGLQISHLFFIQYLAYFLCTYYLINEQMMVRHEKKEPSSKVMFVFCVPVVIMLSCFLITSYRDVKVWNMNARIESGAFKFLYTTKERKEYANYIEQSLHYVNQTRSDKTVMVLHQAPYLYLFLDMKPVVPTTWGIYESRYPTNEPVYKKYFKDLDTRPETIVVINDLKGATVAAWKQQAPWLTEDFLRDYELTKEFSNKDLPHLLVYILKRGY